MIARSSAEGEVADPWTGRASKTARRATNSMRGRGGLWNTCYLGETACSCRAQGATLLPFCRGAAAEKEFYGAAIKEIPAAADESRAERSPSLPISVSVSSSP